MNARHYARIGFFSVLAAVGTLTTNRLVADQAGVEELTRGPVHEAFAASITYNPEPGIVVKPAPPKLIEEIPPEQRPVGDNIFWIPGYWGWDEDADSFVWISGIWRNLPPGREWVPGYWAEVTSGWQWTSGYWSNEEQKEVVYLPQPPESVETGPTSEAPDNNHVWVSGSWLYREDRYAWRPGYWDQAQENWTWIPSSYHWTPRGYVFVDGYWDYDVESRGVVFAPVRFQPSVYERNDYYYTPSTVITIGAVLNHLFIRPSYNHYYFGDYYEPRYRDRGYYASYSYISGRRGYDPIYVHNRWKHRDDRNWDRERREDFEYYRDNRDDRPAHTWADYRSRPEDRRGGRRGDGDFAQAFTRLVERRDDRDDKRPDRFRFQESTKADRDRMIAGRKDMQDYSRERQRVENLDRREPGDRGAPTISERIRRSPVVAKKLDQLRGVEAPPVRRESSRDDRPGSARDREGKDRGPREDDRPTMDPRQPGERPDGKPSEDRRGGVPDPAVARDRQEQARRAQEAARRETPEGRGPQSDPARRPDSDAPKAGERDGRPGPDKMPPDRPVSPTEERKPGVTPPQQRREVPEAGKDRGPDRPAQPPVTRREEPSPQRQQPEVNRRPEPEQRREVMPERKQPERPTPEITRRPEPEPRREVVPERKQPERPAPQVTRRQEPEQRREVVPERKQPERPTPQVRRPEPEPRREITPERKPEPVRKQPEPRREVAPERKQPEAQRQPEQRKQQPAPQQSRGRGGDDGKDKEKGR